MKIGILTLHHSNYNYGAVLQTYSIYKIIENLGNESFIINYTPEVYTLRKKLAAKIVALLGFKFERFRRQYIPRILHKTQNNEDLRKLNDILDGFVVGSDQVWRYREDTSAFYKYFFDFVNDDKLKIAYAASFGLHYWEADKKVTKNVQKLITRFNAISVREKSGVEICRQQFGVDCVALLDPTLLLEKKYFHEIADKSSSKLPNKKYLAYMLLDSSKDQELIFRKVAYKNQLKFIQVGGKKIYSQKGFFLFKSVNRWLKYLKHAEIIITDSFHCTVFSIIFKKQFISIANPHRGINRLENLLDLLGLKSQLVQDINNINKSVIDSEINYEKVEQILTKERAMSINFLKKSLSGS